MILGLLVLLINSVYKVGIVVCALVLGVVGYYILVRVGSLAIFKSKQDVNLATERRIINRLLEKSAQRKGENK